MHLGLYNMRKELAGILKDSPVLKSAVQDVGRVDMIRASMIVRNSRHRDIDIQSILDGELPKEVPVKDFVFIENFCNLIRIAMSSLEMGNVVDKYLLLSAYRTLSEDPEGYFRKNNPVIYSLNHVPPHSFEIDEQLEDMFRRVYSKDSADNVTLKAMFIHNKVMDIFPFPAYNGEIALFAMNYYLMENGLVPISIDMDQYDWFELITDVLKGKRQEEMYNFLTKAVYEKMSSTLKACRKHANRG